jgi:hypothetical protein
MNVSLKRDLKLIRQLKDSSIKCYESNFLFMANKFNVRIITDNWIGKHHDKIITTYLGDLERKEISQAKFIAQMTCLLLTLSPKGKKQPKKKYKEIYDKVNRIVVGENNKYRKQKETQTKTKKEIDNWIEYDEIVEYIAKKEKHAIKIFKLQKTEKHFMDLQQFLIMRLYTNIPPRRLDYHDMTIMKYKDYNDPEFKKHIPYRNLWVYHKKKSKGSFFSFGVALPKTQAYVEEGEDAVIWDCPKEIQKIIYLLRTLHGDKALLYNTKLKPINKSSLSKEIAKAYHNGFKKKIGSTMLRKIYNSGKYENDIAYDERVKIAKMMNHSVNMGMIHYTKKKKN